jgi:hypothetical protein
MFPENDEQFADKRLTGVHAYPDNGGWSITFDDDWSFTVPPDSPVKPTVGMMARTYGRGIGYAVRGLFLDGQKVYYRTEAQDKEHQEIQMYGADARDWLTRWDEGRIVWTIQMGGLGPSYEQCIHITCAEILRYWFASDTKVEDFETDEQCKAISERTREASFKNATIDKLGLSGAQYGAAQNIASFLFRRGPRFVMNDPMVKSRHIQVQRNFPVP